MAFYESTANISLLAAEAITIARAVDFPSAAGITMTDAVTDNAIGVAAESVASGVVCPVAYSGVVMIELGATLAAGVRVSSGTNGVAVAASATGGAFTLGTLLQGGDSGEIVAMLLDVRTVNA